MFEICFSYLNRELKLLILINLVAWPVWQTTSHLETRGCVRMEQNIKPGGGG